MTGSFSHLSGFQLCLHVIQGMAKSGGLVLATMCLLLEFSLQCESGPLPLPPVSLLKGGLSVGAFVRYWVVIRPITMWVDSSSESARYFLLMLPKRECFTVERLAFVVSGPPFLGDCWFQAFAASVSEVCPSSRATDVISCVFGLMRLVCGLTVHHFGCVF